MVNEAGIRDFLINNLDIIEPDLKLVKKEFTLKNEFGAGGRIDILAKDKFGMFVIIEIKKSDKTATQAIHELEKYIALFKTQHGRAANKCRCILLSTEWHELLVPFSEFSRVVDYQVDGYQLILDEEGIPVRKKTIELTPEGEEKFIFPIHNIFLYQIIKHRNIARKKLENILKQLDITNYYVMSINYEGDSQNIKHTFALYLVIYIFRTLEKEKIKKNLNIFDDDNYEFDEEDALLEITNRLTYFIDILEVGTAEKLQGMISKGWDIKTIYKGNQSDNIFVTDEEIIKEIISFESGNSVIYTSVATPRIQPLWQSTIENIKHFLYGNDCWEIGTNWFLQKVESINREATISCNIYYGYDILFALYNYLCRDVNLLPTLEIVAQIPGETNKTIFLIGYIEWDRNTFPSIKSIFNNDDPCIVLMRQKEPLDDLIMMYKHGFEYSLFEITIEQNSQTIIKRLELEEDNTINLLPITNVELGLVKSSLTDFAIHNPGYIQQLCYLVGSFSHFVS